MAKFDSLRAPRPVADAVTGNGAPGFSRSDKLELILLGVSNVVSQDTFYESARIRDERFAKLVRKLTVADPEWVRSFARWLRQEANMRSASIVVAAEYVAAGGTFGRSVVDSVLQRADEPGEMLAYWRGVHGRNIPMPVKRGVADAVVRLYNERNFLRYDGSGKNWRWGDVIEITHPKAASPVQSDLFRYAIEKRHGRGTAPSETLSVVRLDAELMALPMGERRASMDAAIAAGWNWDRLGSWLPGGLDASAWEAVIPNMGAMALVRNLRNFDQAGISDVAADAVEAKLKDPEEIRRSRQFPLRFLSAWKNVQSIRWGGALERALNHSLQNVPHFAGRTLVLIDVSGSMTDSALSGGRGTGISPQRWETAALFGLAVAQRSDAADVFTFDWSPKALPFGKADSVLRTVEQVGKRVGGGTNTLGSLVQAYKGHDRVVILTDEQTGGRGQPIMHEHWLRQYGAVGATWEQAAAVVGHRVPVFTFNLAGYSVGHAPIDENWVTLGGLSDASFGVVASGGAESPWLASAR